MLLAFGMTLADDGKNVFRYGVQFVSPTGELKDIDLSESLKAKDALGFSSGFEHVFFDRVGIDFNIAYSKHDLELTMDGTSVEVANIKMMMPVTVGVNFHMVRNRIVDLYAGPFAGYVFYGDIDWEEGSVPSLSVDNDFAMGAVLGLDLSITKRGLIFTSAVKYLKTQASPDIPGFDEIDLDPWVIQLGLGYRF